MFSKFLILFFIVRSATQGPKFKEGAANGFRVMFDGSKLYVSLELCEMVEDCWSLDVNEIQLLITCEDGEEKKVNKDLVNQRKVNKDLGYQLSIDTVPCQGRRRHSCGA